MAEHIGGDGSAWQEYSWRMVNEGGGRGVSVDSGIELAAATWDQKILSLVRAGIKARDTTAW